MNNFAVKSIKAAEILDSKGVPTIETELKTDFGVFKSSIPSGVSTGKYEAVELRDVDGGVKAAIENIEKIIAPVLTKEDLISQKKIDEILINLDGTKNKSHLGANAILSVSIAALRAGAVFKNMPLYRYIREISDIREDISKIPLPSFNVIEGGKHAENELSFQEFMVIPQKDSFKDNLNMGKEFYRKLKEIMDKKFGKENIELSKEGAFDAPLKMTKEAFDLIFETIEVISSQKDIKLAIDAAASEFFENNVYKIDGKMLSSEELSKFYLDIMREFPINSIEDPFFEEDINGWKKLSDAIGNKDSSPIIVGDDLTATNLERMKMAKDKKLCNGIIIKPNQVGTVTEVISAAKLAKLFKWKIMVSNRAGETEDDFIADLAVGIGADFIKSGAPFPKERMVKYERLVKIEEELCRS
ncbi:enolase [Patescibacteria group bacterium]